MKRWADAIIGSWAPGGVLLAAAALKAWSPRSIEPLWTTLGLPESWLGPAAVALVGVEGLLGAALLLLPGRAWRAAAGLMLAGFAVLLVWVVTREEPPRCGCLGAIDLGLTPRTQAVVSLGKTLVLLGCVAWGWSSAGRSGSRGSDGSPASLGEAAVTPSPAA